MLDTVFNFFFGCCGAYAPMKAITKNAAEWRNVLTIYQNYIDLYCGAADYDGLPDEFKRVTGKNRWWLLMKFFSPALAWFNHEALGLQCLPVTAFKDYNIAGLPEKWTAFSVNGKSYELNTDNSVLMFNDYAFSVPVLKMFYNVQQMLECDKTHRQNLVAQRQPWILEIDEDEKKSASQFAQKVQSDDTIAVRIRRNERDRRGTSIADNMKAFSSGRAFEGEKLASDYRYFDNRNLSMLGYNNENMEKRERLLVDEVNANNDVVDCYYTTRLACEKEAFDEINKRWGYNIQVKPRRLQTFEEVKRDDENANSDVSNRPTV